MSFKVIKEREEMQAKMVVTAYRVLLVLKENEVKMELRENRYGLHSFNCVIGITGVLDRESLVRKVILVHR